MWEILLYIVLGIALAFFLGWKYVNGDKGYWPARNVFFFDVFKVESFYNRVTFKKPFHDVLRMTYNAMKKEGVKSYAGILEMRKPVLMVMDLDVMKHILVKDFDYFINRRASFVSETEPLFHKMLLNAANQEWKDLRSTLSPTFTTGKIRRMFQVFTESSDKLSEFIQYKCKTSNEMEIRDIFTRYTTDVIASAAFGLDSQVFNPEEDSNFAKMAKKFQKQFPGAWKLIIALLIPKAFKYLGIRIVEPELSAFFGDVVKNAIKHRTATGEKRDDFLQLMLETTNNPENEKLDESKMEAYEKDAVLHKASKIALTEDLILSQSLLFFIAGFDTTETLLVLAAYELALNQDVQEILYEEVHDAVEKSGGKFNYETVMQCEYLEKVISETLRKYPPGFMTERMCVKDYKLPNSEVIVEKGTLVQIPIYGIHMDEDYYPNPDKFDPERFSAENKAARHPYSYLPFGHGPRNCIAMRFALTEAKSCVAHLILNFKLEPSQKTEIPIKSGVTSGFRPEAGMFLNVTSRN